MRSAVLLPILASSGALAQMQMFGLLAKALDNSTDGKCHQLSMFSNFVSLVQDPKINDAFTGGDAKKEAMGQAIDDVLNNMLDPLKKDQALVDGCAATVATDNEVFGCLEMQSIDKLNAVISNQTALDAMTKGNTTKQDNLKNIANAFGDRVNAIKANTTQTDYCKSNVDMRCINEKFMQKFVSLASDDAALKAHFNNDTQVQMFKDGAAKAQSKLDKMKADQALSDVCGKMPNILPINLDLITVNDLPTGNMQGMPMMM